MNETIYRFEAVLQKVPDLNGAYVEFPYDVRAEFGKGRVKVHATFDGQPYDGSLVRMGTPRAHPRRAQRHPREDRKAARRRGFRHCTGTAMTRFSLFSKEDAAMKKNLFRSRLFLCAAAAFCLCAALFVRLLRPGQRCSCLRT